jgi:hypothetical protein
VTTPDIPPPAAEYVIVSRLEGTEVVASQDTPLTLVKGGRREDALVRRALFVTSAINVTRPAKATDGIAESYRWTHQGFLQRQVCLTSITGLFACSATEVESLPGKAAGQAPYVAADVQAFPQAEAARSQLIADLKARAAVLFDADRRTNLDPLLKAAGVSVVRAAAPRAAGRGAIAAPAAKGGSRD